jgi:hypothetical protein
VLLFVGFIQQQFAAFAQCDAAISAAVLMGGHIQTHKTLNTPWRVGLIRRKPIAIAFRSG